MNWDLLPTQVQHNFIIRSFNYISDVVPRKELLREWNKKTMTDEEFEKWWKETGENFEPDENSIKIMKALYNVFNPSLQHLHTIQITG